MNNIGNRIIVLTKYFLHGFAFSLLFTVLTFVWIFLLGFLVIFGAILGLIIGIVILILAVGALNGFLAGAIWDFETNSSFWSLFFHGLALLSLLLVVNIVITIVFSLAFPGLIAIVAIFILQAFADGYLAKTVATWFPFEGEGDRVRFTGRRRYLKRLYQEDYKCGTCFWFGKPGCERNEEMINAEPCKDYKRKYYG